MTKKFIEYEGFEEISSQLKQDDLDFYSLEEIPDDFYEMLKKLQPTKKNIMVKKNIMIKKNIMTEKIIFMKVLKIFLVKKNWILLKFKI